METNRHHVQADVNDMVNYTLNKLIILEFLLKSIVFETTTEKSKFADLGRDKNLQNIRGKYKESII